MCIQLGRFLLVFCTYFLSSWVSKLEIIQANLGSQARRFTSMHRWVPKLLDFQVSSVPLLVDFRGKLCSQAIRFQSKAGFPRQQISYQLGSSAIEFQSKEGFPSYQISEQSWVPKLVDFLAQLDSQANIVQCGSQTTGCPKEHDSW